MEKNRSPVFSRTNFAANGAGKGGTENRLFRSVCRNMCNCMYVHFFVRYRWICRWVLYLWQCLYTLFQDVPLLRELSFASLRACELFITGTPISASNRYFLPFLLLVLSYNAVAVVVVVVVYGCLYVFVELANKPSSCEWFDVTFCQAVVLLGCYAHCLSTDHVLLWLLLVAVKVLSFQILRGIHNSK